MDICPAATLIAVQAEIIETQEDYILYLERQLGTNDSVVIGVPGLPMAPHPAALLSRDEQSEQLIRESSRRFVERTFDAALGEGRR